MCEKNDDKKWLFENSMLTSVMYSTFGNIKMALDMNNVAEKMCYEYNSFSKMNLILSSKATLYKELGNTKKAISSCYDALDYAEKNGNLSTAATCYERIASYSFRGLGKEQADFNLAISYTYKAISIFKSLSDWAQLCVAWNSLGNIYNNNNMHDSAITAYRRAIKVGKENPLAFKEVQAKAVLSNIYMNIGAVYVGSLKNLDSVEYYEREAMGTVKGDRKDVFFKCYINMALANISLHKLEKAAIFLYTCMLLNKELDDAEHTMYYWSTRAELDSAFGNYKESLIAYKKFTDIKDSIYTVDNLSAVTSMNLQFETEKKDIEIVEQKKQLKQQRWLIGLAGLLTFMALLVGYFIYRSKKLNKNLFIQREKGLLLEKDNAVIAQHLEEAARKKAELEKKLEQDEKEKSLLREKLKTGENLRLQNEIDFKHKELATTTLNIQQKNSLLEELREHLYNLSEKEDADKDEAIKNMRRSIKSNINFDNDWDKVKVHFENVHTGFFEKLSSLAPSLTPNELKQCAYIKINMNPKEVGNLLGIDAQSVRMSRYRIKKKISLKEDIDLSDFILNL
jgi:tetratricopeptide (TPR) repeat protein